MKKFTLGFILLLSLFSILVPLSKVNIVKAESTIYIRADGSVEGTDKIQRDGNFYTFTGDIGTDEWSYGIIVERDNIVIDGASYLLKGHGQLTAIDIFALGKPIIHGINLEGRNNVTIKNLQIWGFNCGFWGNCCTKIKILNNNLTKIATNIILQYCSHNIISGNTMVNNGTDGIYFYQGHNNTITKNYIKDNGNGIHAYQFSNSTVSGNKIAKNTNGIYLDDYSMCNLVSGNTLANNTHGIGINSCFNNTISGNTITNNSHYGIWLAGQSSNNTITENNITNNAAGISIREASNNKLFKNNFINNIQQVYDVGVVSPNYASPSINNWDTNAEGNYWSDYNGTDNDGDGIGDTSYIIDENNQDNYPLMNNWVRLTPQSEPTTAPPTQWNKGYTELHGTGNCVIQTNDGGYAIAGVSYGEFLLVKVSSTGDVQWWKTYQDGEAYSIVQTSDGGFALAGSGALFNFVKTDSAGNMQWTKNYSKLGLPFLAKSLIQTSDGGYALAGWTSEWDWTIKTDSNGNMQWNKTYGTERAQSFVTAIVEADDGGYALTGNDMLIKIDSSGNIQWNRTYEFVSSLVKTKDGGYLLVGSAVVGSAWLAKTDSQGNMQWTSKYGINGTMNFNVFSSAVQTRDGGYIVAGATYPIYDGLAWIVKTSANGNMEWNATYEPVKGSNSIANWIIQTNDGGYVFTGSKGVGRGYTEPGDVWLVKIATTISEPFPTWIAATIVIMVVVGTALLIYFAKVKKTTGKVEK